MHLKQSTDTFFYPQNRRFERINRSTYGVAKPNMFQNNYIQPRCQILQEFIGNINQT